MTTSSIVAEKTRVFVIPYHTRNPLCDSRVSCYTLCPKKVVHPTHGYNFVHS